MAESTLLGLAAIGASPFALLACKQLRRKTRKRPFAVLPLLIAAVPGRRRRRPARRLKPARALASSLA